MILQLHAVSRDNLFDAKATYNDGVVTVKKGSRINTKSGSGFKPTAPVKAKLEDRSLYGKDGVLTKDVSFDTLSTAASFVTGRTSNGMITWKTPDGKNVRESLRRKE